eukprot:COSAG04_NODE_599_length_12233_cov_61.753750_7_plen_310_part_00
MKELKRKAKKLGADEDHLDDLLDADDPRQEMITLILQLRRERPQQGDETEPQEVSAAEEKRLRRKVKSDRAARHPAEKEREDEALRQEEEEAAEDEEDEAREQEKEEQRRRMAEEKEVEAAAKRKAREELDSRERRADGLLSEAEALKLRQQEEEARLRRLSKSPSPRKVEARQARAAEAEADRSSRQRTRAFGDRAAAAPHPGSGRKWLNEHVYPTLRPSLVALDRCRPSEEHANPDFRMTPSKFLALCLSDPSFRAKAEEAEIDLSADTGLLTFMVAADEVLREAVQEVSQTRPDEPLATIARRLAA